MVFVITNKNDNKIYGIYNDKNLAIGYMFDSIILEKNINIVLNEYLLNSSIIKNQDDIKSFEKINFEIVGLNLKKKEALNIYLKEIEKIKEEFENFKIKQEKYQNILKEKKQDEYNDQELYNIFESNMKVYNKLISDKIINPEESTIDDIPELFRDKYPIYRTIELCKITDKQKQFDFFKKNYKKKNLESSNNNYSSLFNKNEVQTTQNTENVISTDEDSNAYNSETESESSVSYIEELSEESNRKIDVVYIDSNKKENHLNL